MTIELINAITAREETAFSQVYNEYCNRVYSIAFDVVKDEFDAEDIMQEVFIKLPEKLGKLKDADAFEPWLFRMTKNAAIDYYRKDKPVVFAEFDAKDDDGEFSFADTLTVDCRDYQPEESLDLAETQRIVRDIVASLPEEQKEAVMLRFAEGLPLKEIADKTGVPLSTVKSRLKYGKSKIEEQVKEYEKKGTKLYGISGVLLVPFLRWLLSGGKAASKIAAQKATSFPNTPPVSENTAKPLKALSEASESEVPKAIGKNVGKKAAKKAGKHLAGKIIAGALAAATVATGTVAAVKPELLYPVASFLGIRSAAPEAAAVVETVKEWEAAINSHDYDGYLECCEPGLEEQIAKESGLSGFKSILLGPAVEILSAIYDEKCEIDVISCEIEGDRATVTADITESHTAFGGSAKENESTETIILRLIDGKWLIALETFE